MFDVRKLAIQFLLQIRFSEMFIRNFSRHLQKDNYLIERDFLLSKDSVGIDTEMPFHSIFNSAEEITCSRHLTFNHFCWPNPH